MRNGFFITDDAAYIIRGGSLYQLEPDNTTRSLDPGYYDTNFEAVSAQIALKKAAELHSLYVHRRLLNPEAVRAWAREQGFENLMVPEQMHVTIAFSRELVDWSRLTPDGDALVVDRAVGMETFAPRGSPKGGATVLLIDSPELTARWQEIRDAGASYDFPEYRPHVTLTYGPAPDLGGIEPYVGPLIFGPEVFAEVSEDWEQRVRED